ncbi:ATP-binding cassette domain-containing protein [Alteribacter populi]|uniref:ATP-binding cassette domain-containing protein n=1 Tax=Alteribacter populi TaxID=2011011 RepID=UPI000BBACE64|nr:ABC transporter ATP-binding protein [Alteribacter populi]
MMFDVEVNQITLKYKQFEALKDITFTLENGKIYGLIGRNGAGKTTLLSLLASYMEPTSGTIKMGGENPFENRNIMPHVSFIYETDYKDEYEPAKKYLEAIERYRPNFDRGYAERLAHLFKLPLDKPIKKLSNGMQSALNVTIGLASRSPVTIFDEAYLGMDAPTRDLFYKELLDEQSRYPRIMILSTHLVSEMEYLFDDVLMIDKGRLLLHEPFEEIISKGASVTGSSKSVDEFVSGMKQLNTQQLADTKSVMVYGELSNEQQFKAEQMGLEIGPVSLQDLFIHLTNEED